MQHLLLARFGWALALAHNPSALWFFDAASLAALAAGGLFALEIRRAAREMDRRRAALAGEDGGSDG